MPALLETLFHPRCRRRESSSSGKAKSGSGMSSGRQIVTPLGLSILQAIFASRRLAAKPIEQVIWSPIFARMRSLIRSASPRGSAMFALSSLQASSSMDFTVSIGISQAISLSSALCARRNRSGRCVTRTMSGQIARASGTRMTFLQPARFGFLRAGDDDRRIGGRGLEGNDADGLAPQMRHRLLHD